jgi:hypothetical protein
MDKINLKFWNGFYYCTVRFPDGTSQELKSAEDLTYTQWRAEIKKVWESRIVSQPSTEPCTCPLCQKSFVCPNRTI